MIHLHSILLPILAAGMHGDTPLQREWDFTPGELAWKISAVLFFVLLNAFFVAAEFAIVKVRSSQIEAELAEGNRMAVLAKRITQNLDGYLSASQLGITLASIALGMLAEPVVARIIEPLMFKIGLTNESAISAISFGLSYAIVTYLHVVLGEQMPKSMAIRKALGTTLIITQPLHLFYIALKPAIWVLNSSSTFLLRKIFRMNAVSEAELAHSEEELRHIVSESERSSEVTETEKDILLNALALNDRCVRDVMTPRNQVVSLNVEESFDANMTVAIESKHTRFPLVEGHLDHSIGLIHIKDLLALVKSDSPDLRRIKRELHMVAEMMPIDKLLRVFLDKHAHFALVVDEYGGAVGVVTLDNVLEEIVGDIQDEFDSEAAEFHRISDDEFTVEGTLNLYELAEHAGLELESDEVTTIGGYITHLLGHLPKPGESAIIEDYEATVTKADQRRVLQMRFKRVTPAAFGQNDSSHLE